jgi:transcriptional antiterminator RfaH
MNKVPAYSWYAIYTNARAEKKVEDQLKRQGIECYLPLQKRLKQWSDRKKWVEEPLFRSYLFVFVSELEYMKVLQTYGVVRFITFERKAVAIPPEQITLVRRLLLEEIDMEVVEQDFEPGDLVEVNAGPMMGMKGELVSLQGEFRVRVRFELLAQSILVNIPAGWLKTIRKADPTEKESPGSRLWQAL